MCLTCGCGIKIDKPSAKGKKIKVDLVKLGIVSKQPKINYDAPVVNRPARDTRAKSNGM